MKVVTNIKEWIGLNSTVRLSSDVRDAQPKLLSAVQLSSIHVCIAYNNKVK
jgi:hypothetical protein